MNDKTKELMVPYAVGVCGFLVAASFLIAFGVSDITTVGIISACVGVLPIGLWDEFQ